MLKTWLRKKGIKTQTNYLRDLMRYLRILAKNGIAKIPQDLLDLARGNGEFTTAHVDLLEEFQVSCENILPEDERNPITSITVAVMSFYSIHGRNYQFPKGRGEYKWNRKKERHIPQKEDVIGYIDTIPHLRNKMIVAVETSAPFRLESWLYLKWSHFREVLEDKEIPHIGLKPKEMKGKGKARYRGVEQHCFLTPFSKNYVLRWKEEYERITGTKISLKNEESLELPFLVAMKGETKGKLLSYGALNQIYERCKTKKYPFTIHVWRTYVNEGLEDAGIQPKSRDIMIGHKLKGIVDAYSEKNI